MLGILLAAGFSRRFGITDKLLQALPDGSSIALASAKNLIQAIPISIAVVRTGNKALAELLQQVGLHVVYCDETAQEMADSLTTAIRYSQKFDEANDGFVIALADMPYIAPATIQGVSDRLNAGASIVIPTYQGKRGHPVGFSAKFRDELLALKGDEGARSIIKRHADEVTLLETNDAGLLADIDTPADLKG
ncbi:MAG TPA: nucleotidyltransferase family protein [Methylotenera sp.]|nr:nucleotidyltransferase family protein [Methylotenera sp.]